MHIGDIIGANSWATCLTNIAKRWGDGRRSVMISARMHEIGAQRAPHMRHAGDAGGAVPVSNFPVCVGGGLPHGQPLALKASGGAGPVPPGPHLHTSNHTHPNSRWTTHRSVHKKTTCAVKHLTCTSRVLLARIFRVEGPLPQPSLTPDAKYPARRDANRAALAITTSRAQTNTGMHTVTGKHAWREQAAVPVLAGSAGRGSQMRTTVSLKPYTTPLPPSSVALLESRNAEPCTLSRQARGKRPHTWNNGQLCKARVSACALEHGTGTPHKSAPSCHNNARSPLQAQAQSQARRLVRTRVCLHPPRHWGTARADLSLQHRGRLGVAPVHNRHPGGVARQAVGHLAERPRSRGRRHREPPRVEVRRRAQRCRAGHQRGTHKRRQAVGGWRCSTSTHSACRYVGTAAKRHCSGTTCFPYVRCRATMHRRDGGGCGSLAHTPQLER